MPTAYGNPVFIVTAESQAYNLPPFVETSIGIGKVYLNLHIPAGFPGATGEPGKDATEQTYETLSGAIDANELTQSPRYYFVPAGAALTNFPGEGPGFLSVLGNDTRTALRQEFTNADGEKTRIGVVESGGWATGLKEIPVWVTTNVGSDPYYSGYFRVSYVNESDTLTVQWVRTSVYIGAGGLNNEQQPTDTTLGPHATGTFAMLLDYVFPPGGIVVFGDTIVASYDGTDWTAEPQTIQKPDYLIDIINVEASPGETSTTLTFTYSGYYQIPDLDIQTISEWV